MENTNQNIRNKLKSQRAQLSLEHVKQSSISISKKVKTTGVFNDSQRIGFYHSVKGEADPSYLKTTNKEFFLPLLSKSEEGHLTYIEVTPDTRFENNKFNIPEPIFCDNLITDAASLDLVIVPLVAFDRHKNRLGMGGGYYDRTFAFKQHNSTKPILMGFAYDFQEINTIETEWWDIGMDIIVTETRIIESL